MDIFSRDFTFLESLEQSWEAILAEYRALQSQQVSWPEPIHNGLWHVIGLKFQNRELPHKAFAPVTSKLCEAIPGITTYGFSIMKPGCEITPHVGYTDAVLRGHLGLVTNPQSGISVAGQTRVWEPGKAFVFDDTMLHSAWNRGSQDRVILLFDFMR